VNSEILAAHLTTLC